MREKIQFPLIEWIKENNQLRQFKDTQIELFFDSENSEKIFEVIKENDKKFSRILFEILSGRYNDEFYRKEDISDKSEYTTAMKFHGGKIGKKKGLNIRLYCKEYFKSPENHKDKRIIVVQVVEHKKDMDKKLRNFINTLGNYEYQFGNTEGENGSKT